MCVAKTEIRDGRVIKTEIRDGRVIKCKDNLSLTFSDYWLWGMSVA